MSNLNDFIGGTSLNFWRSDGIPSVSTHGPYDSDEHGSYGPQIQILGTTTDAHYYGKEFKLHHVPDRRVFSSVPSHGEFHIKLNLSADTTNAPSPTEDVSHEDNLVPTMQAVIRCLSYKIYTKQLEGDSYVLKDTISLANNTYTDFSYSTSGAVSSPSADVHRKLNVSAGWSSTSNQSHWWQDAWHTKNNFANIIIYQQRADNINESFIDTDNTGPIFIKTQWELDNTAWNNIFSRSYNEVEGIMMQNTNNNIDEAVLENVYSGQRSFVNNLDDGNQY